MHAISAESCVHSYTIQPGPTSNRCNLGHASFFQLMCQITSDGRHSSSINWHYSNSMPEVSDISSTTNSINDLMLHTEIKYTVSNTTNTSSLEIALENDVSYTEDGYFWCSVTAQDGTLSLNPSLILHVPSESQCPSGDKECQHDILLYTTYSSGSRCADHEISVDIIEAQPCSQQTEVDNSASASTIPVGSTPASTTPASQNDEQLITTNMKQEPSTVPPTLPSSSIELNLYVVVGGSVGGVIILICIIGLVILCVTKQHMNNRRREQRELTDTPSPFDDIRMYTGTKKAEDDEIRVSKLHCESNVCYDKFPHASLSQSIENIYETIH